MLQRTLSPAFAPGTTSYTTAAPAESTFEGVTATLEHSGATLTINGASATSGTQKNIAFAATLSSLPIDVTVTAENGTTLKTYTITVNRQVSTNANLSGLSLKQGSSSGTNVTLTPSFSSSATSYTASVPHNVSQVYVSATRQNNGASVAINGSATSGKLVALGSAGGPSTPITVRVTAEDGTTTMTYNVNVTRNPAPNTNLASNPTASYFRFGPGGGGAFSTTGVAVGGFVGGKYTIIAPSTDGSTPTPNSVYNLGIRVTAAKSTASVTIGGLTGTPTRTKSITLSSNTTNTSVRVTDGAAFTDYPIQIIKSPKATALEAAVGIQVGTTDFTVSTDTTPPEIVATVAGTMGPNGWYTSDVDVEWSFSDPESPITDVTDDCVPLSVTWDTPPEGVTLTCTATSGGGTGEASITIKRDTTPPQVVASILEGGVPIHPSVWSGQDLTVRYTCADASSGLASGCGEDDLIDAEGEHTVDSGQVCDVAGNCGSASITGRSDRTGPTLILPTGLSGTTSGTGLRLTYDAIAAEPHSGILRHPSCSRPSGSWFPVGTVEVTCTALDLAGNSGSASFPVTVEFVPPA